MEFRTTTQPFSEDISSSSPETTFRICKSNSQYHKQKQHYSKQFKCTWNQSKTTESTAERQLVDPSIFTLASDSGCFLVLSSCVICVPVCDKHNPKAHKAMETHKHYGPTNKISAYAYESQCHFCIHSVRASQRAQTGIVQSLLSEAAQRKHRVTASQNKCQRSSLSCWCLHRLSGNRTIQVHTVCFSVVAFMGCHQWCLSHQSSWNSTTHHWSFNVPMNPNAGKDRVSHPSQLPQTSESVTP